MMSRSILQKTLIFLAVAAVCAAALDPLQSRAERNGPNKWRLNAIAFPDGRDVEVRLGGSERALAMRGVAKVKWRNDVATIEITADKVPSLEQLGVPGGKLVLWAIDSDKKIVNLGPIPVNGSGFKLKASAPMRIFGLLMTIEKDPSASSPGSLVVSETRLPMDSRLVLPVFQVEVALGS